MSFQRLSEGVEGKVKGDLRFFSPKCGGDSSLFRKNTFPFAHVEPFGYDKMPNKGIVKFLATFGAIFPSPQKQGDETKISQKPPKMQHG